MSVTKQILWRGMLERVPARLSSTCKLLYVDRVVIPVANLRCTATLKDDRGIDITPCGRCMLAGMSSPLSYLSWDVSNGDNMYHILHYDVVIICNGMDDHVHRTTSLVATCTP